MRTRARHRSELAPRRRRSSARGRCRPRPDQLASRVGLRRGRSSASAASIVPDARACRGCARTRGAGRAAAGHGDAGRRCMSRRRTRSGRGGRLVFEHRHVAQHSFEHDSPPLSFERQEKTCRTSTSTRRSGLEHEARALEPGDEIDRHACEVRLHSLSITGSRRPDGRVRRRRGSGPRAPFMYLSRRSLRSDHDAQPRRLRRAALSEGARSPS